MLTGKWSLLWRGGRRRRRYRSSKFTETERRKKVAAAVAIVDFAGVAETLPLLSPLALALALPLSLWPPSPSPPPHSPCVHALSLWKILSASCASVCLCVCVWCVSLCAAWATFYFSMSLFLSVKVSFAWSKLRPVRLHTLTGLCIIIIIYPEPRCHFSWSRAQLTLRIPFPELLIVGPWCFPSRCQLRILVTNNAPFARKPLS